MEESQQEATEKEVERILGLLQTYFREDREYGAELQGSGLFGRCVHFTKKLFLLKGHFLSCFYLCCWKDYPCPPFLPSTPSRRPVRGVWEIVMFGSL